MNDFKKLREISEATSMVDVLNYYQIECHEAGDKHKCRCPFHDDSSPSMTIYHENDKDSWYCWVCAEGGDSFKFIREIENNDYQKAWSIICGINKIEDPNAFSIENLKPIFNRPYNVKKMEAEKSFTLMHQLAGLTREYSKKLSPDSLPQVDELLLELDTFLLEELSYADVYQYYKTFLTKLKQIK